MSNTLAFLNLFEIIIAIAMLLILFILKRKPWATYVLLAMTISLGITNVVQLVLEIKLERFLLLTIFSIIIWAFDSFLIVNQILRRKRLQKLQKECEELRKSLEAMYSKKLR